MSMTEIESAENMTRVDNLLRLHEQLTSGDIGAKSERDEILRSAVVFLHSTIEELVRNLFIEKLPSRGQAILDEIPFSIHISSHRAKGILLGELLEKYSGKFLENIVHESIGAYVDTMNLNDTTQLSVQLQKAGIDISEISCEFHSITELMKRRHQIVHQMDRSNALDPDKSPISEIESSQVIGWRRSVDKLVQHCIANSN